MLKCASFVVCRLVFVAFTKESVCGPPKAEKRKRWLGNCKEVLCVESVFKEKSLNKILRCADCCKTRSEHIRSKNVQQLKAKLDRVDCMRCSKNVRIQIKLMYTASVCAKRFVVEVCGVGVKKPKRGQLPKPVRCIEDIFKSNAVQNIAILSFTAAKAI